MTNLPPLFNELFNNNHHFFFSTLQEEATAVLEKKTLISPLSSYGLIHVSGADAKTFLQGQLSCDLNSIEITRNTFGAYCTVKGRVQSFFLLFKEKEKAEDAYLLCLPQTLVSDTLKELRKYALFSKVTLVDASNKYSLLGVYGEEVAVNTVFDRFEMPFPRSPHGDNTNQLQNDNGIINRLPAMPNTALLLLVLSAETAEYLWKAFLKNDVIPIGFNAWQLALIENKIPSVDAKTSGEFLPHSLGLPSLQAVSFKKGCYRGQEIVARMEYLGKNKKHLYLAECKTDTLPENGSVCVNESDAEAGQVVNASWLAPGKALCLIVLHDNFLNQKLLLQDGRYAIEIVR